MESFSDILRSFNVSYSSIPIDKIIAAIFVLTLTQVLRRFLVAVIIKSIERFTRRTKTTLDDELIEVLKPSLSWLILIGGLWTIKGIWAQEIGSQFGEAIDKTLYYIVIFISIYIVYRGSSILGQLIANMLLHTDTELDELLKPLMPKIFQAVAVIFLTIKISEIFLGQSAGALIGLLGGAGITLGLLLKDIVYDWFCTLIIYSDHLYREGDWVGMTGVDGFVEIKKIGFRTTTLHLAKWGSIMKVPNSKMITGIVDNWSQNPDKELKWGLNVVLKIDNLSARQTARFCNLIQEIPKSIPGFMPACVVRFKSIVDNARVIEIMAYINDDNLYFDAEKNLNLAILDLLEQEGIDFLSVKLETDPGKYKQSKSATNN
jgi:MscS family membrane protein